MAPTEVFVPLARLARWVENFTARHGGCSLDVRSGALTGAGTDGSTFTARAPFGRQHEGPAELEAFASICLPPARWGMLLVRKGGFAVALLEGGTVVDSKVGQRHVQGRTKAGGQSQQRFARRRDNQARQAYAAAAEHSARILAPLADSGTGPAVLVTGGAHDAVEAVLDDPRLRDLSDALVEPFLPVPDPRRKILETAIADASSVRMTVTNT